MESRTVKSCKYSKTFFFEILKIQTILKANSLNTIQHMNIYSQLNMVKIMMEIQHAVRFTGDFKLQKVIINFKFYFEMTHGGDMLISRQYETSAIRQGFVLTLGKQNYYSEVFTLYGFVFELVAEQVSNDVIRFYMQVNFNFNLIIEFFNAKSSKILKILKRLSTDDPSLSYEQNQLETFSLRTDRCCTYSINIQYWHRGNRAFKTTGLKKHRFGKAKSKMTKSIEVIVPQPDNDDQEIPIQELLVSYAFIFPPD